MKRALVCFALILVAVTSTTALRAQNKPVAPHWVQVTRAMVACGAVNNSPELRSQLLSAIPLWKARKPLPEGCRVLKIGEKFLLDADQTADDRKTATKLLAPVCPRGCTPSMTPVYAPARAKVGIYLHRTRPPAGW
jgi:hypothetical protein